MKYQKNYLLAGVLFLAVMFSSLPIISADEARQPQSEKKQQDDKKKTDNKKKDETDDDQIIKLGTQLVTVPFTVTEKSNRYINDLKKEDIEVLEDNKPQVVDTL